MIGRYWDFWCGHTVRCWIPLQIDFFFAPADPSYNAAIDEQVLSEIEKWEIVSYPSTVEEERPVAAEGGRPDAVDDERPVAAEG